MLQDELICLFTHSLACIFIIVQTHIYIHSISTAMDESYIDTQEAAWTTRRNRIEAKTDIILISPRFTSIERFLVFGGGTPLEMYYERSKNESYQ